MRGRWLKLGGLAVVAVLVLAFVSGGRGGGWSFVRSTHVDDGVYFRLKVALTYKGEPQDFDIVVACNVKRTRYGDGSRTVEGGLIPVVFGRRMSDGRGLVVRAPDACRGETTANGMVPPELLPLVVVYDDADTLAFGTAYLSQDAYDGPLSLLTFGGATIEAATRAEFETFRREQPNLVTREAYFTPQGEVALKEKGLSPATPFGHACHAYARFRLIGEAQERARAHWPEHRPRLWVPSPGTQIASSGDLQTDREGAPVRARGLLVFGLDGGRADSGMVPGDGGRVINSGITRYYPPSFYPDAGPWISPPWPEDPFARARDLVINGPHHGASVDFRDGAMRGFGYCWAHLVRFVGGDGQPSYTKMPQVNRVDDSVAVLAEDFIPSGGTGPLYFYEEDQFVWTHTWISLENVRGDV